MLIVFFKYLKKSQFFSNWLFFILLTGCTSVFYQPDKKLHVPPQVFDIFPNNLTWQSDKETKISGWFFKADQPKGTVLQFHGNGQNMSSHYMQLIWLVKQGFNLITFDYRGYGRSQGSAQPRGVHRDGVTALEESIKLHNKHTPSGPLIVIGQSLGGAVAARAIEDLSQPNEIDLLVLDSTFSSYKNVAFQVLKSGLLTFPISPLAFLLVSDEYSSENSLKELAIPTIVAHATNDPIVPFSCGEKVFTLIGSKDKTFWKTSQGGHASAFLSPYSIYRKKLLEKISTLKPN